MSEDVIYKIKYSKSEAQQKKNGSSSNILY